jgi:hypothetical protein
LKSHGIPNEIANLLFAKVLEPGFDYEEALASGGLATRELFNILILLIQQLQQDPFRIPVKTKSVMLVFDGSLASFVALDCLSHIHNHGDFTILSVKDTTRPESSYLPLADHIPADLHRRCDLHYKKPGHQFQIINLTCQENDTESLTKNIMRHIKQSNDDIVIAGINNEKHGDSELSFFIKDLPYSLEKTVILAKSCAKVMPLTLTEMSRKFVVCFKTEADLEYVFKKSVELMRPVDTICILCIHESRQPRGDYFETRFSLGASHQWVRGPTKEPRVFSSVGWNEPTLERIRSRAAELLMHAQINGSIRLEEESCDRTIGQDVCRIATDERADFLCLRKGENKEVTIECVAECKCSIVVFD